MVAKRIVISPEARARALHRALVHPHGVIIDLTAGQRLALERAGLSTSRPVRPEWCTVCQQS